MPELKDQNGRRIETMNLVRESVKSREQEGEALAGLEHDEVLSLPNSGPRSVTSCCLYPADDGLSRPPSIIIFGP